MACLGQRRLWQWAEHVLDIRLLLKRGGTPIRGTPPKPEGISRLTGEGIREVIRSDYWDLRIGRGFDTADF